MTDEFDTEDVYDLFDALPRRNDIDIELPMAHEIVFNFEIDEYDAPDDERLWGAWRFAVNTHNGNIWLHERTDDGTERRWSNT